MGSSGQEEAPGIFWAWVEAASGNMALALTTLVEQVQSWAKGVGVSGLLTLQPVMDTLGTLLVGWMIFVTLILILGTFFYFKFIHHLENEGTDTASQGRGEDKGGARTSGGATQGKAKAIRKEEQARKPTIVPERKADPVSAPVGTGADPDAVKWACNVFTWLYNSAEGGKVVNKVWLDTLNENTVKTAIETGILIEVVELMKQTPAPVLSNMVVDCSPTDNVTITCDCDATLYLRIITTRTQGDQTTESEYACAVTPLRGRLNIAAVTAELLAVAKFDGWPEVSLTLEGIRNNATGRDEQQMLDVINEVVSSALRNSVLEFNFQPNQTFPRFRRARQVPDPIIPVGYDSMVREKQTHPPSVPRKTPKAEFVPLHNEKIEPAGESFTALTFSNLTSSEEQLIARNLNKYPSLENADMAPEEIEEFCKTWQENYVPAKDVPPPTEKAVEEEPPPSPTAAINSDHQQESEAKTQNFVLMVSSRSKLIDEPRNALLLHDDRMNGEEEEEELADVIPQRPRDEPCLRKETGSPLLLGTPRQDSLGDAEDDEFEDAKLQFDRLEILDKPQISGTLGLGPLHKGPFVSEACCVGVQVGVAAQLPQLDLRIETAAVGGSVACDLPEYDQEASARSPLPPSLHNQPSSATTPESCVDDVSRGPEEPPSPSPIHSLSPEPFIPAASGVFHLVDDSNNERGVAEWEQQVVSADERGSIQSSQPSGVVACIELGKGSVLDRKDSGEAVSEGEDQSCSDSTVQDQDVDPALADKGEICPLDTIPSPDNSDGESLEEGNSPLDSHTDSSNILENSHGCESESEEREVGPLAEKEKESKLKICLNEFTENLFRHIDVEDSELSIPEERVEDLPWEVVDVYEPDSPPMSLPSPRREGSNDGSEELEGPDTPPAIDTEEPDLKEYCNDPKIESENCMISSVIDEVADAEDPESEEHCDDPERDTEENGDENYMISSGIDEVTDAEEPEPEEHCDDPEIETEDNESYTSPAIDKVTDAEESESKEHCSDPEIESEVHDNGSYLICSKENENFNENYFHEEATSFKQTPENLERVLEGDTEYREEKEDIQTEGELEELKEGSGYIYSEEKKEEDAHTEKEKPQEYKEDSGYICTEETHAYKEEKDSQTEEEEAQEYREDSGYICTEETETYREEEDSLSEEPQEHEEDSGYIYAGETYIHTEEDNHEDPKESQEYKEDSGYICNEDIHIHREEEESQTEEEEPKELEGDLNKKYTEHTYTSQDTLTEDSREGCIEETHLYREDEEVQTDEEELDELKKDSSERCLEETHLYREDKEETQTEEEELNEPEKDSNERCLEETHLSKEDEEGTQTKEEELDKPKKDSSERCLEETHSYREDEEDTQTEEEKELDKEDSSERYTEATTVNNLSLMPHSAESSPIFLDENGNGVGTDVDIDEDNNMVSAEKDTDEDDVMESTEMEVDDSLVTAEKETADDDMDSNKMEVSISKEVDEDDIMNSTEIEHEERFASAEKKVGEDYTVNNTEKELEKYIDVEKEVDEDDTMNNFEKEIEERFIIAEKEAEDDTVNSIDEELKERFVSAEKEADGNETEIKLDYSFISTARDTDEDDTETELEDRLVDGNKKTNKKETEVRSTEIEHGNKNVSTEAKLVGNLVNNAAEADFFDSGIGPEIEHDEDNLVSIGHDESNKFGIAMTEHEDKETVTETDKEINMASTKTEPEGNLVSSKKDEYINLGSAKREHEDNETNTGKDINMANAKIEPEENIMNSKDKDIHLARAELETEDNEITKICKDNDITKIEPVDIEVSTVTNGDMSVASTKTEPGDNIISTETHKAINLSSIKIEPDHLTSTADDEDINTASTEITPEDDIINTEIHKTINMPSVKVQAEDNLTSTDEDEDINTASTEITPEKYLDSTEVELDQGSNIGNAETAAESKDVVDAEMKLKGENMPCTVTEMKTGKDSNKIFTETELGEENVSSIKMEGNKDEEITNTEVVVNKLCTEMETDKNTNEVVTEIQLAKGDKGIIETDIDEDINVMHTETVVDEDTSGVSSETESDRGSHNISTEIEVDNDELSTEEANKDSSYLVSTQTEVPNKKTNTVSIEFDKDTDMINIEFDEASKEVGAKTEPDECTVMINREVETNDRGSEGNSRVTEVYKEADGNENNRDIVNRIGESQEIILVDRDVDNQETEIVDKNGDSQETEVKDRNMDKQETEVDKTVDNKKTEDKNLDDQETKVINQNTDSRETVVGGNLDTQERGVAHKNGFNQEVKLRERNRDGNKIQRRVSSATDLDKVAQLLIHNGDTKSSATMKPPQKNTNGIHLEAQLDGYGAQVNTETRFDGGSNKNGHAVEILHRNSNGINSKTELSRSVDSNDTNLSKAMKTKYEEDKNDDSETEIDEEIKNTTSKTVHGQASRKHITKHQYRTRHPIDTYSASEQEEEHDHFDMTLRRARRQKLQVTFLVSDSGEDTSVSISSLESLNTQLQEAEKNNYYISLRSPSFWDDSTTDANTDDEYTDPRLLPKDPFSPEEEDFGFSGYTSQHSAYDSMTDSEVEGITGRYTKGAPGGLQMKQEWRKSDIDLIAEAEVDNDDGQVITEAEVDNDDGQVTPTPTPFQDEGSQSYQDNIESPAERSEAECVLTQYKLVGASQNVEDQTSHQDTHQPSSQEKEDISTKDITENSSHEDALQDRVANLQEPGGDTKTKQQKQEYLDTSMTGDDSTGLKKPIELTEGEGQGGGGGETTLTTGPMNVATLTHTDSTGALTQPQVKPHTGQWVDGGGDGPDHHPPVPGSTLWTRHLPSYPVYGPYSVSTPSHSTTSQPMGIPGLNGKRLLVKIVKAMGVGCEKPVFEAYSVVEMDEPPQKFTTSVVKDTNSPFWDEQFLFDLSGGTLELLFELYDKSSGTFLGLGIVGIEELVATPSQRQIIPLQSRPYENDEVSGSLTVEFLFLDRADLPEHTLRASTTSKSVTPRGDLITTTTTTYIKAPEAQDVVVNGGDGVAAAAIRDIEEKTVVTNNASRSTMIIHASKKEATKKVIQVQRAPSGEYEEVLLQPDQDGQGYMADDLYNLTMTATTTGTPTITTTGASTAMPSTTTTTTTVATSSVPPSTAASTTEPAEDEERGRSRGVRRKRDSFFGTLKKRFSRSKVRSKSMDPGMRDSSLERDPSVGRSISMERSSTLNRASAPAHYLYLLHAQRLLSVPSGAGGDAGSTRSSLSDASAISGSSTRTYVNEASTLIIETSENGVFKHYLIPLSLQQKSKWRKKGLKLHIFGEHTFIAKHMSSSTQCEVCQKTLGRRFGKQGYICRDCGYKCHKPCHVKTEITCPNSTVNNMDLEYVRDPKEERRAWLKKTKTT
ncbi:hypothetical protein O3P69_007611 [Scylla paramamosain]|uniref:SEA domain-containing protein n=1 Tax=Scylla paramamosain TaxID=85552 RepID=A0AAW0UZM8_SCYPA